VLPGFGVHQLVDQQAADGFLLRAVPDGFPNRILRVAPDILPVGSIRIGEVWINDERYANFYPAQEVQQAREGAEDSPHLQDVPYCFGAQSANGGEGHADRATDGRRAAGREQFERIGIDHGAAICAAVDAGRQEQDAPLAGFLDRGAQPVVGGAAVVQDLGKEGRRRRGIELQARLMKTCWARARAWPCA